ncbi:MAG: glycosyltransferase [Acidimicrobiia bacterium]|nr:glycosyltransferase [Acidimicrobiia bacterium]
MRRATSLHHLVALSALRLDVGARVRPPAGGAGSSSAVGVAGWVAVPGPVVAVLVVAVLVMAVLAWVRVVALRDTEPGDRAVDPMLDVEASGGAVADASDRSPLHVVVVHAHNDAATLGATVASLLAVGHDACRVLVIDDGSTDATLRSVGPYLRHDDVAVLRRRGAGTGRADLAVSFGQALRPLTRESWPGREVVVWFVPAGARMRRGWFERADAAFADRRVGAVQIEGPSLQRLGDRTVGGARWRRYGALDPGDLRRFGFAVRLGLAAAVSERTLGECRSVAPTLAVGLFAAGRRVRTIRVSEAEALSLHGSTSAARLDAAGRWRALRGLSAAWRAPRSRRARVAFARRLLAPVATLGALALGGAGAIALVGAGRAPHPAVAAVAAVAALAPMWFGRAAARWRRQPDTGLPGGSALALVDSLVSVARSVATTLGGLWIAARPPSGPILDPIVVERPTVAPPRPETNGRAPSVVPLAHPLRPASPAAVRPGVRSRPHVLVGIDEAERDDLSVKQPSTG